MRLRVDVAAPGRSQAGGKLMAPPRRLWFRFYVEAIHDRKLRRRPPSDRWLWVVLLAVAREAAEPGQITIGSQPATDADLADLAALKEKEVRSALSYFISEGMLVEDKVAGVLTVAKFKERQYESDTSAERMAKHRASDDDVTAYQRHNDGDTAPDVTALRRRSSRARVTESETDTEKPTPPVGPPPGGTPPKKRACRLPEDWAPSEELLAWAAKTYPHIDAKYQTDRFKDYWQAKAGADASKHDWDSTWRNWIRGAAERAVAIPSTNGNGHGPPNGPTPAHLDLEQVRGKLVRYLAPSVISEIEGSLAESGQVTARRLVGVARSRGKAQHPPIHIPQIEEL
jgi:hypothetical protein